MNGFDKLIAERNLRGGAVPPEQVAEAGALLADLQAAALRHPCAQTENAQEFLLPRVALDIVISTAKLDAKEAKRAANREAYRLRDITPRPGLAEHPPAGVVPNDHTEAETSSNRGSGRLRKEERSRPDPVPTMPDPGRVTRWGPGA